MGIRILMTVLLGLVLQASAWGDGLRKMSPLVRQAASAAPPIHTRSKSKPHCLTVFVRMDQSRQDDILRQYGCKKWAGWGDIIIADIPQENLSPLADEPAVSRIEASRHASLTMDTTAMIVNALPAYHPDTGQQAYTGEGVILGIMDVGFDLTHPNFLDPSTNECRISAFWDQLSPDTLGSSLPVGRDFIGPSAVRAQQHSTDAPTMTHGTYTTGIAAGSGYDTPYRGIAFGSDICAVANLVNSTIEYVDSADYYKYTTATDALGMKYCFDYAARQGKPCVVSLSEGYNPYLDREDSLYAAVLDSLIGPGRIIVSSAGNEGIEKSYMEKAADVSEAGAFIRSFRKNAFYRVKAGGPLQLNIYRYAEEAPHPTDTLAFSSIEVPEDTIMRKSHIEGTDTLQLSVYREHSRFTDDDIWQVLLTATHSLDSLPPLAIVVGGDAHVEVYGSSTSALRNHEADSRWNATDGGHNILAPSCFSSVICVGATTHRLTIRNEQGDSLHNAYLGTEPGLISPFSSTGPSINGLMKPDVVAPGTYPISSYSHYYHPEEQVITHSTYDGETYPWGADSGTSMSAPIVAGTIALWLQACPTLSPDDVRAIMERTCRKPEPDQTYPNNIYGHGEIDAYRGLLDILGTVGITGLSDTVPTALRIIPNEGGLRIIADTRPTAPITVRVYELSGKLIHTASLTMHDLESVISFPYQPHTVYAVQCDCRDTQFQGSCLVRL